MKINLIIFTITTKSLIIQETIKSINNDYPIYLLSPHIAFENEINKIKKSIKNDLCFISIYEFISQREMEYCDIEADTIILNKYSSRSGKLTEYYSQIKKLKNQIILKNVQTKFEIIDKYILANDLGIDDSVWIENNYINKILDHQITNKNNLLSKVKNLLFTKVECNILKSSNESYYLLGKPNRTLQYLKTENVELIKLSYLKNILFNILYKLSILKSKNIPIAFLLNLFIKFLKNEDIKKIIVPVHEDREYYSSFAKELKYKYINIQDGYLPSYYTSAYLKYREYVDEYYIWDKLSEGIFRRHKLSYKKWNIYKNNILPIVKIKDDFRIKKIVFLSSGAGDWTALKNRSDEDLILLALVNISKIYNDIEFVFRPHPLWLHPQHQGINSIQRVIDFIDSLNLYNFKISGGALKEGLAYTQHQNLSTASSSIDEDINSADLILGDHSQSIIVAAKRNKLIASISLTKRKEFFSNYTDLGFPILKSENDLIELIDIFSDNSKKEIFLQKYNNSIKLYNKEYS